MSTRAELPPSPLPAIDQAASYQGAAPRTVVPATTSIERQWYIRQQFRQLKTRHQGNAALSAAQWRRWAVTLVVGWICAAAILYLLVNLMRFVLNSGYWTMAQETTALRWFVNTAPIDFSHAVWLGAPGDPIIIIPVFMIGTLVGIWRGYPLRGLSIAAAYLLVSLLVLSGWLAWDRPRPELIVNGMAAPDLHSFPSGHMAQTTAVYGMIWYFWLRKIRFRGEYLFALTTLALWIGVVAVSRLELGAHWVTDIVAGVFVGLLWLAVLIHALRRAEADAGRVAA